jgi:hypothetical protein
VLSAHALRWSGPSDSLQDTFTNHFARPDVTDSWHKLARLNVQYWSQWAQEQVRSPWLVAAVAIGSVTLVRRYRTFGLIAVAVALTGFLNQAAHPVASQSDRLLIEVSVAAVLGLPLLANPRSNTPAGGTEMRWGRRVIRRPHVRYLTFRGAPSPQWPAPGRPDR